MAARILAAAISRVLALRMLDSRPGFQVSGSEATPASSITASIALLSSAAPSSTPPTIAAGAECGRPMDRSGSTSAATTATSAAEYLASCRSENRTLAVLPVPLPRRGSSARVQTSGWSSIEQAETGSAGGHHAYLQASLRFATSGFAKVNRLLASRSETEDHDGRSPPYSGR